MGIPDIRARAIRWLPLLACAAVLVWHAAQYWFVTDDAYISFVYARNLAEHGELVFNVGMNPVEGYTNFSWTVLLGVLMVVGLQPEITSLVLGVAFGVGGLVVAYLTAAWVLADRDAPGQDRAGSSQSGGDAPVSASRTAQIEASEASAASAASVPVAYLAPLLLALSAGYACWSSGGLETQLFTFLVTLSLYAYVRGGHALSADAAAATPNRWLRATGALLALSAMTRPEGLLVTAVIGLHRLVVNLVRERRLRPSRDELWCVAWFLALWAPWYAWRWWYYGYPFPNTFYVKAAGEPPAGYHERLRDGGLYYVWQWLRQTRLVYAAPVALAGLLAARPRGRRCYYGSVAAPLALLYIIYTVRVGGDFMGLHRFLMPLFPIAALGVALALAAAVSFAASRILARPAAVAGAIALGVVVTLGVAGVHGYGQWRLTVESLRWGNFRSDRGIDTPAFLRVYALDRYAIGRHMRACFRPDDFSIVGGAGAQPYAGRMQGIDVFGLVSERVAHEVRPTNPRAGHNKWAPAALLGEYEPEFVFSCYAIHRDPRAPRFNCGGGEMAFWQRRGYRKVTVHIPGLLQHGEYYTFLVRKDRPFTCPGLVD